MAEKSGSENIETLLKYLLAIELWRGGLTQAEIRKRLKMSGTTVAEWLKGVSRHVSAGETTAK